MGGSASKVSHQELFARLVAEEVAGGEEQGQGQGHSDGGGVLSLWEELFQMEVTPEGELMRDVSLDMLREIRQAQPNNIIRMVQKSAEKLKLFALQRSDDILGARVALLLLTRIATAFLPLEGDTWMHDLLWAKHPEILQDTDEEGEGEGEDSTAAAPKKKSLTGDFDMFDGQCLAELILNCLGALCFRPNFTLAPEAGEIPAIRPYPFVNMQPTPAILWESGCLSKDPRSAPGDIDVNRSDVLQCILAMISSDLYHPSENSPGNPYLDYVVSPSFPYSANLFMSMMNCVLSFTTWTMLPYSGSLFQNPRDKLVGFCLQLLDLFLVYKNPGETQGWRPRPDPHDYEAKEDPLTEEEKNNVYVQYVRRCIRDPRDHFTIYNGIKQLLSDKNNHNKTYLPYSQRDFAYHRELFSFLFLLVENNLGFRRFIARQEAVGNILYPLLCLMVECKNDPAQIELLHVGSILLHLLSVDREFSISLAAEPFSLRTPASIPWFQGNHADFLTLVVCDLVLADNFLIRTLYPHLFNTMMNMSPYVKHMAPETAQRLITIFKRVSKREFMESSQHAYQYTAIMVDVLRNYIQYQYHGTYPLVYHLFLNAHLVKHLEQFGPEPTFVERETPFVSFLAEGVSFPGRQVTEKEMEAVDGSGEGSPTQGEEGGEAVPSRGPRVVTSTASSTLHVSSQASEEDQQLQRLEQQERAMGEEAPLPEIDGQGQGSQRSTVSRGGDELQEEEPTEQGIAPTEGGEASDSVEVSEEGADATESKKMNQYLRIQEELLPKLSTLSILLEELGPRVRLISEYGGTVTDKDVMNFLAKTTLVGFLPVPHAIISFPFTRTAGITSWLSTCIWGQVFLSNYSDTFCLFDINNVRLFEVQRVDPPTNQEMSPNSS